MDLKEFSKEKLAEWWNIFCVWDWPSDYPDKPGDFDTLDYYHPITRNLEYEPRTRFTLIMPIMHEIEKEIGLKECLRYHHINNLNSNNLKFEWWWFRYHVLDIGRFL
jgi:hypothetical protein